MLKRQYLPLSRTASSPRSSRNRSQCPSSPIRARFVVRLSALRLSARYAASGQRRADAPSARTHSLMHWDGNRWRCSAGFTSVHARASFSCSYTPLHLGVRTLESRAPAAGPRAQPLRVHAAAHRAHAAGPQCCTRATRQRIVQYSSHDAAARWPLAAVSSVVNHGLSRTCACTADGMPSHRHRSPRDVQVQHDDVRHGPDHASDHGPGHAHSSRGSASAASHRRATACGRA